ncbi:MULTISPECIES: hypothetical protein [unclassified Pseudoalteromonas]|uniref:hypothetical protein n=1 Tax=unclassified Pseudoalteromonas TaxID=194690 RepID=UPI00189125B2|nr:MULTISPECIES: hypothetical protein [unclassified Pseudoalteromonas]MCG7563738.1 hypothetical protein [Pseudoalteromonas sp. McH1-42]
MTQSREAQKAEHSSLAAQIKHNFKENKFTNVDPMQVQKVKDAESDRGLKQKYAWWFIGILVVQLFIMNLVLVLVGMDKLHFEEWTLNLYMAGTLAEVFGVILVITKNLFPTKA